MNEPTNYINLVNALGFLGLPLNVGLNELENTYKRLITKENNQQQNARVFSAYTLIKQHFLNQEDNPIHSHCLIPVADSLKSEESWLFASPRSAANYLDEVYQHIENKSSLRNLYSFSFGELPDILELDKETTFYLHIRIPLAPSSSAQNILNKHFNFADFFYWMFYAFSPVVFLDKERAVEYYDSSLSYIPHALNSVQTGLLWNSEDNKLFRVPQLIPSFVVYQISNITPRNFFLGLLQPFNLLPCVTHYFTNQLEPLNVQQTEMLIKLHDEPLKCPITNHEIILGLLPQKLEHYANQGTREKINSLAQCLNQYTLNQNQNYLLQFIQHDMERCCTTYCQNTRFFRRAHDYAATEIIEKLRKTHNHTEKVKIILSFHDYLLKNNSRELVEKIELFLLKIFDELVKPLDRDRMQSLNIQFFFQKQKLLKEAKAIDYGSRTPAYTTFILSDTERLLSIKKLITGSEGQIEKSSSDNCFELSSFIKS